MWGAGGLWPKPPSSHGCLSQVLVVKAQSKRTLETYVKTNMLNFNFSELKGAQN